MAINQTYLKGLIDVDILQNVYIPGIDIIYPDKKFHVFSGIELA